MRTGPNEAVGDTWDRLRKMYGNASPGETTVELYVTEIIGDTARNTGLLCYFPDDYGEAVVPPGVWIVERVMDEKRGRVAVRVECDPGIVALCSE
jgi:hypothetical protein